MIGDGIGIEEERCNILLDLTAGSGHLGGHIALAEWAHSSC